MTTGGSLAPPATARPFRAWSSSTRYDIDEKEYVVCSCERRGPERALAQKELRVGGEPATPTLAPRYVAVAATRANALPATRAR